MITRELLASLLRYDSESGLFYKIPSARRPPRYGPYVANMAGGYVVINVAGKTYYAHRLAFLYEYGFMPHGFIDHINGVRDDNRICNLREASDSENGQNRRSPKRNSKTMLGTTWCKCNKSWKAQIMVNRKNHHLGLFKTEQDAHNAYMEAKRQFHPVFGEVAKILP